jgi:hypothetical protein
MTDGKFIMAAGGWPIRVGGTTIGGIGVSGGNAPGRDEEIARAGLVAVGSQIPTTPMPDSSLPNSSSPASQADRPLQYYEPPTTQHLSPDQNNAYNGETSDQSNSNRPEGQE